MNHVRNLIIITCLFTIGCEEPPPPEKPVRPVKVAVVRDLVSTAEVSFPGKVNSIDEVALAFRVPGRIEELPVKVGDRLEKGGLVGKLDTREYEYKVNKLQNDLDQLKQTLKIQQTGARQEDIRALKAQLQGAKANQHEAELQLQRTKNLLKTEAIPKSQYDQAKAAYEQAQAQVNVVEQQLKAAQQGARREEIAATQAKIRAAQQNLDVAQLNLEFATLDAPFNSLVSAVYADDYQVVPAGQPVVKLVNLDSLEVSIDLPSAIITRVGCFRKITCCVEPIKKEFPAEIREIGSEANPSLQTYPITFRLTDTGAACILPGMAAEVRITVEEPEPDAFGGYPLPTTAVFSPEEGASCVWVVSPDTSTVHRRDVTVTRVTSSAVRVTGDIEPGDVVVIAGVHYLHPGQKVRTMTDEGDGGSSHERGANGDQ